jgi:hypothetical protein
VAKNTAHQFGLFGFVRPLRKIPISAARIEQAKEQLAKKDYKGCAETLRNTRYKLEAFERSITSRPDANENLPR